MRRPHEPALRNLVAWITACPCPSERIVAESPKRPIGTRSGASDLRVARGGVEPPTYRFSVGRSYQLSYLAKRGECYMSTVGLAESAGQPVGW